MHRLRTISLLALGLCATIHAQTLSWDAVIECAPEDAGALRPRIAVNASGEAVVLWSVSTTGGCYAARQMGSSFMAPVRVDPVGGELAAADWQGPAIAAHGDALWVVYKGLPEDMAPCYLVGSTDGGATWGDTLRVDPFDGLVSRFPSVAVAPDGSPVVEYMQFTSGYLEPRHVVRAWADGSFLPPAQVSTPFAPGEVCDCCTGEVGTTGSNVVALYRNAGNSIRTIWGAASADGGATFATGAQVDATNWSYPACPSSGPDLYLAGDSIRYVWMSGEENGTKVYLGSAHAGTLATGVQMNVHADQPTAMQQNFPRIAGQGDTLGIVWEQFHAGQREILFAWRTTGIAGLSSPDTVNVDLTAPQRAPDIAYADGAFHIVWSEPNEGQVRYRKAVLVDDTGISLPEPTERMQLRYDAVEEQLYITGIRPSAVELFDMAGRRLVTAKAVLGTLRLDGMAPGCYVVRAMDGQVHCGRFVKE